MISRQIISLILLGAASIAGANQALESMGGLAAGTEIPSAADLANKLGEGEILVAHDAGQSIEDNGVEDQSASSGADVSAHDVG